MKVELFPFQKRALADIRMKTAEAMGSYHRTHASQVVSFTAPTGAGKTIIMASLIESIFFGDELYEEQQKAIIIWLSDSPQLNEQSKLKIEAKADKIRINQCVTVSEDFFDKEVFEDGRIYFLNTQKLSKSSNLTKKGDGRTYTIWETIANTIREKSDYLYFIIDEAHRGMQGSEAGKATTIMQKFIKGSEEDGIYRRYIANIDSESIRKQYDKIVSNGDVVSEHNFRLPETIQVPYEDGGLEYRTHLFVSEKTGCAKIKLGTWEAGVIAEEEKRNDFVCWIRNPSRASWALCIPYKSKNEFKSAYPDFIIVRRNDSLGYVIDILEPHRSDFKDNLGKAKGFAEYARKNPGVGRIQLIREMKDATGNKRYKRLDMSQSAVRDKVLCATTNDEIDHIFDTDGFFM